MCRFHAWRIESGPETWPRLLNVFLFFFLCFPLLSHSMVMGEDTVPTSPAKKSEGVEERWGIKPKAIRLTGGDFFLDFRYHILDPEKAAAITKRGKGKKAFLIDQETGKEFPVSVTKLGPMRATAVKPHADRDYVIMFTNVGKMIKKGSKVTVVVGDCRVENLVVE
jgi:hypothetical protein